MDTTFSTVSILSIAKLESDDKISNSTTAVPQWKPPLQSSASTDTDSAKLHSKVSPSGSLGSICRICHEGDTNEKLLAPCRCTGSVGLIHATCLEHWLTSSNSDKCELCKFVYNTQKEPRSCFDYLRDSENQYNVRNLIADIVCFFLLTPLLVISTYLCVLGAHQYFIRERWEAIGLIILAIFLLAVYLTWCHVTLRFHVSVCAEWQGSNQHVRLEPLTNYNPHTDVSNPARIMTAINIEESSNNNNHLHTISEHELNDADTSRIIV
jgi:hypothetical protein